MLIGYARTSTVEQTAGFEAQQVELDKAGCEKLFMEQTSSVARREQLDAALDFCRADDTLVVTKLDRLARSVAHLVEVTKALDTKGAHLRILAMGMDTSTSTGRLMLNVLGSVAQFEREVMLERQREGIAKAKAEGRYKGRVPTARRQAKEIVALKAEGLKAEDIAERLGVGRSSVFRIIKEQDLGGSVIRPSTCPKYLAPTK